MIRGQLTWPRQPNIKMSFANSADLSTRSIRPKTSTTSLQIHHIQMLTKLEFQPCKRFLSGRLRVSALTWLTVWQFLAQNGACLAGLDMINSLWQNSLICMLKVSRWASFIMSLFVVEKLCFFSLKYLISSDWPVCKLAKPFANHAQVRFPDLLHTVIVFFQCFHQAVKIIEDLTADLKEDAKHKIFYQNAIDFYQLDIIDWVERRVTDFTNCCLIAPIWENVPHDELVPPPHALSNIVEVFHCYHYQETVIVITWFGSPCLLLKEV